MPTLQTERNATDEARLSDRMPLLIHSNNVVKCAP
jgi:hypothetical protein